MGGVTPPSSLMTKSFLIVICIIIAIALIIFPLIVSYKEQKNKKK
jgi:preprotein translocase subunit SecG